MSKGLYEKVCPSLISQQDEPGVSQSTGLTAGTCDRDDQKARALILTSIEGEFVKATISCKTAKSVWDRLIDLYEEDTTANKIVLQKEFYDLQMTQGSRVMDYIAKTEYIAGQLRDMGEQISDELLISKIVSGLTSDFKHFFSSWLGTPEKDRTIKSLSSRLRSEESRMNPGSNGTTEANEVNEGLALHVTSRNKFRGNKKLADSDKKPDERYDKKRFKCFYCHKYGHLKRDCRKRKADEEKSKDGDHQAIIAEANNTEASSSKSFIDDWVLDTGASDHMIADKENFVTYKKLDNPKIVRYGNRGCSEVLGIGDVQVASRIGKNQVRRLILKNVLHVPRIGRNLLSLGSATDQGSTGVFTKEQLILKNKNGDIQVIGSRLSSKLWKADLQVIKPTALYSEREPHFEVWHERLGHIGRKTIEVMLKHKVVDGMNESTISEIACKSCALGKQSRKHFPSRSRERAIEVGQRVHVDICGPIGTPTIRGYKYFVLFKDEFSNYRHIYFVGKKDEVHQKLRVYVTQLKNEANKPLRTLVSDRGSELTSRRTQEFLLENGISHEVSAPFTPEQNGLIERDNRTIAEAMRTMLIHKNLPEKLWGEAANTAVYLLNRVPNKNTGRTTPFERYFGKKPRVSHLRAYGCLAMMKLQEKKRSGYQRKLEHRARETILVGYEMDFTYRLYDPKTNQVYVTREANFDELRAVNTGTIQEYPQISEFFNGLVGDSGTDDEIGIESQPEVFVEHEDRADDEISNQETHDASTRTEQHESIAQEEPIPDRSESQASVESVNEEIQTSRRSSIPVLRYNLRARKTVGGNRNDAQPEVNCCFDDEAIALLALEDEPECFEEAIESQQAKEWSRAMDDEYKSLIKNQTWDIVDLPPNRQAVRCKWVYRIKRCPDGSIDRFKARLVAKGFSQKYGFDYTETYSPVARHDSIRLVLAIVAQEDLEMRHFDVRTAFLYGSLSEEIYMEQPPGYVKDRDKVCRLRKSLYGLKQASKCWNECFTESLRSFGLKPLESDNCILVRKDPNCLLIVLIYVDDGLACCSDEKVLNDVIKHLQTRFEISVMNPSCFIGLEIHRNRAMRTLHISQKYYINKIVSKFKLDEAKGLSTPADSNLKLCRDGTLDGEDHETVNVPYRQLIGSLMYAMLGSRPDIAYSTSFLASFSENPKATHWTAAKRILRYLKSTANEGLLYNGNSKDRGELICYVDSDFAGDIDSRRSTSGYVVMYNGAPIVWKSQKQPTVALSTTEAEFIAACYACRELLGTRQLLKELGRDLSSPTKVMIDNQAAIRLIQNPNIRARTKHIDVKFKFIQEKESDGIIMAEYVSTDDQVADILTKALPKDRFETLKILMGLQKLM